MTIYCKGKLVGADLIKYNKNIVIDRVEKNLPKIGILNLMPNKYETERQLLELLSRTSLNMEVKFIRLVTHECKSVPKEYLIENYEAFNDIKDELDCLIVTGAPVEKLDFEDVSYIDELNEVLSFAKDNNKKSIFICWGAQAALNHYHGIRKELCDKKIFGIFDHNKVENHWILEGISNDLFAPHSRHTKLVSADVTACKDLKVIAKSDEAGEYVIIDDNSLYILGHCEYHKETLKNEYFRDLNKGLPINIPKNYFVKNDPSDDIIESWKEDGIRLYDNWLKSFIVGF
ncbi:homoserine O-succinyltransferase [Clostridium sp. YIM B02505]|uniref:Homoserine O-acetyltransferase n=1 Tax=Clostridium yunnanense TaxID=2800325 RepID=A0ABS1EL42_9CLOT|nr:homoserine O-succinyltransferase [Clostridium yunnanense]MBK1810086.1 homoserine O-succinyltransferase [Clostridium yunnanense]